MKGPMIVFRDLPKVAHFESRQMMAADIHLGSVFYEPHQGLDKGVGNTIQVSFDGGAAGTQLTHLVIDGSLLLLAGIGFAIQQRPARATSG